MEVLSKNEIISSEVILKSLEKNIAILKAECYYNSRIEIDMEVKLEWFKSLYRNFMEKLETLQNLSITHHLRQSEIKCFISNVLNLWFSTNRQICEKYGKLQMPSKTSSETALSVILETIKKGTMDIKRSLEIHKTTYLQNDVINMCNSIAETERLLNHLESCDEKLQKYVYIAKLIPELIKLKATVNSHLTSVESVYESKLESDDLDVFPILVKLLTGELLGEEPLNPNCVLAENIPRKPVFIIRNIKRKADTPKMNIFDVKMIKKHM